MLCISVSMHWFLGNNTQGIGTFVYSYLRYAKKRYLQEKIKPEKMCPYNSILRICLITDNIQINGRCVCCKYAMWWTDLLNVRKY
jgi:hypothetical protein